MVTDRKSATSPQVEMDQLTPMKDSSFTMVDETLPSLCIITDKKESLLKSTILLVMAMIAEEPDSVIKANVPTTMESEMEVIITSLDKKLKYPKDVKCRKLVYMSKC